MRELFQKSQKFLIGLVVLAAALLVFASQQGGDGDGAGPLNAIARAAERTQREPGGHAKIRTTVSAPGSEVTVAGQGVYDAEDGRSRMFAAVSKSDADEAAKIEVIPDGTMVYMRSSRFDSLPDGAEWVSIDLALGDDLETPVPAGGDASGELEMLEEATGPVEKLGSEDVHGVPTTRYRGAIDVSENAEHLREAGGEKIAAFVEEEGDPVQVEAWVDAGERVRRMRVLIVQPREDGEGPTTVDMRMDFFGFGAIPEIEVPESDEVFDATSLAEDEIDDSGDE